MLALRHSEQSAGIERKEGRCASFENLDNGVIGARFKQKKGNGSYPLPSGNFRPVPEDSKVILLEDDHRVRHHPDHLDRRQEGHRIRDHP